MTRKALMKKLVSVSSALSLLAAGVPAEAFADARTAGEPEAVLMQTDDKVKFAFDFYEREGFLHWGEGYSWYGYNEDMLTVRWDPDIEDRFIYSNNFDIAAEEVSTIQLGILSDIDCECELFYIGSGDGSASAEKSVRFLIRAADEFVSYSVRTDDLPGWEGSIRQVRVDIDTPQKPGEAFYTTFDYIRFVDTREDDAVLDELSAAFRQQFDHIDVYETGELAVPAIAEALAAKYDAECSGWLSVPANVSHLMTMRDGTVYVESRSTTNFSTNMTIAVKRGYSTLNLSCRVVLWPDQREKTALLDGSFETSVLSGGAPTTSSGWRLYEGNDWNIPVTLTDGESANGSRSLHIESYSASLSSEGILSNLFAVDAGTQYTVEYSIMVPEGTSASGDYIYPYLRFSDANGNYLHAVNGAQFIKEPTDGWVKCSFDATPSAGDVYGCVAFFGWSGTVYEAYVDSVAVYGKGSGYLSDQAERQRLAKEKVASSVAVLQKAGLSATMDTVGNKLVLADEAMKDYVDVRFVSASGDAAAYFETGRRYLKLLSKPAHGEGESTASVKVLVSFEGVSEELTYQITVKEATMQEEFASTKLREVIEAALDVNGSFGAVSKPLAFMTSYDGYALSWHSSNTSVLTDGGDVIRPKGDADGTWVTVTLTASADGEQFVQPFDVFVLNRRYDNYRELALENGGFEGAYGWRADENRPIRYEFTNDKAFFGSGSMRIPNTASTSGGVIISEKAVGITEDRIYRADAMVFAEDGAVPQIGVRFYNNDGTLIGSSHDMTAAYDIAQTGQWQHISACGTAPTGASRVAVVLYGTAGKTAASWYDDVHVYEIPLLENGDFANSSAGWKLNAGASVHETDDAAELVLMNSLASSEPKPAAKGKYYAADVSYMLAEGDGSVSIVFTDYAGKELMRVSKALSAEGNTALDAVAPPSAMNVYFEAAATGELHIGSVRMTDGALTGGIFDGGFETYYGLASGASSQGTGSNLVTDGSFEKLDELKKRTNRPPRENWELYEGRSYTIPMTLSAEYAASGSKSVHICNTSKSLGSEGLLGNTFEVQPGVPYTVEYSVYIPAGSPVPGGDYIYPYLELYDENGNYTHRINGAQFVKGATDGFVKCHFTATPVSGDRLGAAAIYAWSDTPYEVYVDDVRVYTGEYVERETYTVTDEEAYSGEKSLKIGNGDSFTSNPVHVLVGKDYIFRVKAKAAAGKGTMTVEYFGWNGGTNTVGGYTDLVSFGTDTVQTAGSGEWETLAIPKTIGFKVQYVRIKLTSQGGDVYFDDLDTVAVSDGVSNASMENIVSFPRTESVSADLVGAAPYDWKSVGQIAAATSEDSREGIMSLRVESVSKKHSGAVYSSMVRGIVPGETYVGSIDMKVTDGSFDVNLNYYDDDFTLIAAFAERVTEGDWRNVLVSGRAPSGAAYASLSVSSDNTQTGRALIDCAAVEREVKQIGSLRQMFIDDYIIGETTMERTFRQGEKRGVVLQADKPWEGEHYAYIYGSAIYDEDENIFKMWYTTGADGQYFAYATSEDGIHWDKPVLNIFDVGGSTKNNILGVVHSPSVIKDYDEPDPDKRYKMVAFNFDYTGSPQYANSRYGVRYSADGLHWGEFIPTMWGVDVISAAYDKTAKRYISLLKRPIENKRMQYMSVSDDFEHWSEPIRMNSLATPLDDHGVTKADSYGMGLYPYEGVYVGFDWRMRLPDAFNDGHIDVQLAFSRDLNEDWQRPTQMSILPCGNEGEPDWGVIYTASSPVEVGDEVWLYYTCGSDTHGADVFDLKTGLAVWRKEGFASLDADCTERTMTTKPFVFDGSTLHINADAADGALYAELLDENGKPVEGFSKADCDVMHADAVDQTVSWNGRTDVSALSGKTVSLKLYATNCELYAFGFEAIDLSGMTAAFEQSGTEVTENTLHNGDFTASFDFGSALPQVTLMIAAYQDGRLTGIRTASETESDHIELCLPQLSADTADTVKVFVFDTAVNLKPLCDAYTFTVS